ncbi:MAG: type VI secretion system Vgr family protein, partial [Telluria sp.]
MTPTAARDVIVVAMDAHLDTGSLLGHPAALEVSLADGTRTRFAGDISELAMLGSDGGLARYRIRISPWLWRLGQVRNSRVWQDKTVIGIVDSVFESYLPLARWRWSDDTGPFMDGAMPRSYRCQYRETDLDLVRRILTEEGLCWRFEQTAERPGAVLFADSSQSSAIPDDPCSAAGEGIRFHGARSVETQDAVQALTARRRLHAPLATVLSYDYKAKKIVTACSPSRVRNSRNLPELESFDVPGEYAYANGQQARRYADLQMKSNEARSHQRNCRSTVRCLRAGTRIRITGAPLQQLGGSPAFTIVRVASVGVNNMPAPARQALAELFGPIPELLQEIVR